METFIPQLFEGRKPAMARAVSIIEDRRRGWEELLAACHPRVGGARRIGITGPPGAGKSTLTTLLAERYLADGFRVAVVAVDPTSPFTGGALLGDRIRMGRVMTDPGVFIRSMASRGALGGLARRTAEAADVLDAFGKDRILIETVGVGQSEVEIAAAADTTVVVLSPEAGDAVQTMKAGLMEIADVFVVNKADREGADKMARAIEALLDMDPAAHAPAGARWRPPVLLTTASTGDGVPALAAAIDRHRAHLEATGGLTAKRRARVEQRIRHLVEERLWSAFESGAAWTEEARRATEEVVSGRSTPHAVARRLIEHFRRG